jgi:hypothetical protein
MNRGPLAVNPAEKQSRGFGNFHLLVISGSVQLASSGQQRGIQISRLVNRFHVHRRC